MEKYIKSQVFPKKSKHIPSPRSYGAEDCNEENHSFLFLASSPDSCGLLHRCGAAAASWSKSRAAGIPGLPPGIIHGNGIQL